MRSAGSLLKASRHSFMTISRPFPKESRQIVKRSYAEFRSGESNSWFAWYSRRLDTHPISTKCVSAGMIAAVGNVLAQVITFQQAISCQSSTDLDKSDRRSWRDFHIDSGQVGRFALLNVAFAAPLLHHWYNFIDRALPGKSMSRVLQRTFWDEFVFSPMYIPVFLGVLWRMEGTEWHKIKCMIVKEVPGIILAEWVVWVPTMIVTFRFAPVKFQVLVINVVGVAWQTFVSFMAAHAHATDEHTHTKARQSEEVELYLESVVGPDVAHQGFTNHRDTGDQTAKATSLS